MEDAEDDESMIDVKELFGGPGRILGIGGIDNKDPFLDSTSFKKFHYSFNEKSTPDMMVISYKSKKFIDNVKHNGNIFIDMQTDAIVAIESHGIINMSLAIKSILFIMGIRIDKSNIIRKEKYRQINDRWYPENIQLAMDLTITKKNMFQENEHSDFGINWVFSVNKFELDNPVPIALEKRFNSKNEFETQVFNENGLSWSEINIIKKE